MQAGSRDGPKEVAATMKLLEAGQQANVGLVLLWRFVVAGC